MKKVLNLFKYVLVFTAFSTVQSCKIDSKPIAYGEQSCHFCRMTIVDQQHAAQIVTSKGKVFSFDAVECMLNHLKDIDTVSVTLYLVNDYTNPKELIDAKGANYLVSQGIPSPMGEFLTAFSKEADALKARDEHGGDLYSWDELLNHFNP